jgi:hypothetical protein
MKSRAIQIGLMILLTAFARVPVDAQGRDSSEQGLGGSWDVRVNIRDCASGAVFVSFSTMRSYNVGGTMQEASADRMFQPGHGVWRHTTGRAYSQSFHFFQLDSSGVPIGTVKIVGTVKVEDGGSTFTAETTFQSFDLSGNAQGTPGCATESATRYE